jgi:hypothetical protein
MALFRLNFVSKLQINSTSFVRRIGTILNKRVAVWMRVGEWKKAKIDACLEAIGYVSNIMQHGFHGQRIELIKVVYVIAGEPQIKDPLRGIYSPVELEPASDLRNKAM